ncbi:hypothetical protein POTOM_033127 [Populus tomentosa]|uniref:RNase H type-1 domain-containing protein n=1 Tax=Populus tomentosa TaxID=118781 RepID=A0A8X7Z3S5_POPTO|nr:hypothetical protein POTOM_033127 [Populus tomentosa]
MMVWHIIHDCLLDCRSRRSLLIGRIICNLDSINASGLIHDGNFILKKAGVVIVDAKKLLSREWEVHLLHILREANSCAHFMAKHGARNLAEICIRENPPPGLSALLLADSMGTRYHRGD